MGIRIDGSTTAAIAMAIGFAGAGCDRPDAAQCEAFAEHVLTVSSQARLENVTPSLREDQRAEVMKRKSFLAEKCEKELTQAAIDCARRAATPDALERCGD